MVKGSRLRIKGEWFTIIMRIRNVLFIGPILFVLLCLCSCHAAIEDTAANSASSIFAVVFEYIFAIIALLISLFHRLIRALSVATIVLGIIGALGIVNLSFSPIIFITIGVALLASFFIPIRPYFPQVIISKNVKKVAETWKEKESRSKSGSLVQIFLVELVLGIILLLIEYTVFSN